MKSFGQAILLLSLFSYSFASFAKTIVVSDIDDTIKKSNSVGPLGGAYYFLQKKPYIEMRDIFQELKASKEDKGQKVEFFYVSAAFDFTFDASEWLNKHSFPEGEIDLRTIHERAVSIYDFKHEQIKRIVLNELKEDPSLKIYFFGDNADQDAKVYSDIASELNIKPNIYIRDVRAEATYFASDLAVKKIPGVHYYFSEKELTTEPGLSFMSDRLKQEIGDSYSKSTLIPSYTLKSLEDRLTDLCLEQLNAPSFTSKRRCSEVSEISAKKLWTEYYSRY